jgi:signal peptidase II
LKKFFQKYGYLLAVAGIIIFFDQLTKIIVRSNLDIRETWAPWPWLEPYARIVHWQNTGAVFGILQGFGDVFMVLAMIVSAAIIYYFPQVPKSEWPLRLAMGMQCGGAIGNLIDRLHQGHVTDFISVFNFAVFNIADASISVGVAVLVIGVWIKEGVARRAEQAGAAAQPGAQEPEPEVDPANALEDTGEKPPLTTQISRDGRGD